MDKRNKRRQKKRSQRRRERRKSNRQSCQHPIQETLAPEESDELKDFETTRNELFIAQRDFTERLAKNKDPVIGAILVSIIQAITWGIAKMDTNPKERFPKITFKIMNRYTGKEYRKWVSRITKVVFNSNEEST